MQRPLELAQRPARVAAVQIAAGEDRVRNHSAASRGFDRAVELGASLIVLPEKWSLIGDADVLRAGAQPIDGSDVALIQQLCRRHRVWCVAGSIALADPRQPRLANASLLVDPEGSIRARYDKIHMFDVEVGGVSYRESDAEQGGRAIISAPLAGDLAGWVLGMTICYDLRFPELYRALALGGAHLVTVPAAFTMQTGRDHWEVLLRARAIENSSFVIASNVIGDHGDGKVSYGRSMIIDPWGVVLAQATDDECVITADLDMRVLEDVRRRLPSLASRVPDIYG